jgi:hypothetical protein
MYLRFFGKGQMEFSEVLESLRAEDISLDLTHLLQRYDELCKKETSLPPLDKVITAVSAGIVGSLAVEKKRLQAKIGNNQTLDPFESQLLDILTKPET